MNYRVCIQASVVLIASAACGFAQDAGNLQVTTTRTLETYVPNTAIRIAAIELRGEATVAGGEVTLRQVCRWPAADDATFAPFADLVVMRFERGKSFGTLPIDQVQSLLRDAGVNPGMINFAGAASCTVSRSDVRVDEAEALRAWVGDDIRDINPADPGAPPALIADATDERQDHLTGQGDADPARLPPTGDNHSENTGDLRARLINDIAIRLAVPAATLQVDFRPEDRKLLTLREPFEFTIEPQRSGDLGETSWTVAISGGPAANVQRVRIVATARAWMEQVVLVKPLDLRQTITEEHFEVRRVLADRISRDPLATKEAAIGQQAARDLKPGTVLTMRMLAPVELVRAGQLVTVLMRRGNIEVKTVATALQSGSSEQMIKVKNERTNEIFQIKLTGRQTGVLAASD